MHSTRDPTTREVDVVASKRVLELAGARVAVAPLDRAPGMINSADEMRRVMEIFGKSLRARLVGMEGLVEVSS